MTDRPEGCAGVAAGRAGGVFVFFSNRLGCAGSLLLSAALTLVLLLAMGVIRL